jgi:NADH dehydrogenase (ubiquinone) 1 alpha subcomplex subunit 8
MACTNDTYLPTYDELYVPPLNLTSPILRAGAIHFGVYCEKPSNVNNTFLLEITKTQTKLMCFKNKLNFNFKLKEFMLCRNEERDPRKCLEYNKDVSKCALEFFNKVKVNCAETFTDYWHCLDSAPGGRMSYKNCVATQKLFDQCMAEKVGIERPPLGDMARLRLFSSDRKKPVEEKKFYGKLELPPSPTDPIDPVVLDSIKRTNDRVF